MLGFKAVAGYIEIEVGGGIITKEQRGKTKARTCMSGMHY